MGNRYQLEAVDKVLDVLAADGGSLMQLLTLRSRVLANEPAALDEILSLANGAGIGHLLEQS